MPQVSTSCFTSWSCCKTILGTFVPYFLKANLRHSGVKKREKKKRSVGRWRWTVKHPAGRRSPQFLGGGFLQMFFFVNLHAEKPEENHPSWVRKRLLFNHQLDFGHANKARLTILVILWPYMTSFCALAGSCEFGPSLPAGKRRVFRVKKWKRKFETAGGWLVDRSLGG